MNNTAQTPSTTADPPATLETIIGLLPHLRDAGQAVREILLANLVMVGEIPAPTFEQVALSIVEEERPPMIEIPEYREKFHL